MNTKKIFLRLSKNLIIILIIFSSCSGFEELFKDKSVRISSSSKEIISFNFLASENAVLDEDVTGIINGTDINLTVPPGTDVTSLIPDITIKGHLVNPGDGIAENFSSPVIYTVTAENLTNLDYNVTVCFPSTGDVVTFTTDASTEFKMIFVEAAGLEFRTRTDDRNTDTVEYNTVTDNYLIAETEVTYELWSEVYSWAVLNGYSFSNTGQMGDGFGDTDQHSVTWINWRDSMVWCNALTEYYN